jgi:outer membrane protein TolC
LVLRLAVTAPGGNLFCEDFRIAIAPEILPSNSLTDSLSPMAIFHSHGCLGRLLAFGLLAIPIGALGQPVATLSPLPEDLIPALRPFLISALAQSPQMISRDIDVARAEGDRINDRAGMLPSMGTNVQYGSNTTTTTYSSTVSSSSSVGVLYNASANQAIYHWGALKAQADIGKIGLRIAERNYADAYRLLIVSIRTQFMDLIGKKISLRNATYALQQAEEALAAAKDKIKAKTLPPGADIGAQMAVDDARLNRDRMVEDLDYSTRVFALSVGQNDFTAQNIPEEIARPSYAPEVTTLLVQRFVQDQGENTYAIANLHDQIKIADLNYRIAKVGLRPMFGFNAYFSQQTTANVATANGATVGTTNRYIEQYITQSRNFNVVANWSIFDGLATRGRKLSALSYKRTLERSLRTTVDQNLAQVRDLEKQLGFSWRGLSLTQQRRDMAEGGLNGTIDYVKRGFVSANDINAARMGLFQADLALAAARADFLNRWSTFLSTLCVDPMLDVIPKRYLPDGK